MAVDGRGRTSSAPALVVPGGLRRLPLELVLVGVALLVNLLVRWYTLDDTASAVAHGRDVLVLEQRLGLDWEHPVQRATLAVPGLGEALSHVYVWGYLPVLAGVMVWLYLHRWTAYRTLRNALLSAGAIGMLVYAFYPCAPPWIVGGGFTDTVAQSGWLVPAARPEGIANHVGALPSFHIAYLVLPAVLLASTTGSRAVRAVCVLLPALMAWAIVATGNHWVLDIPAGLALATAGLLVARWLDRRRSAAARRRSDLVDDHVEGDA